MTSGPDFTLVVGQHPPLTSSISEVVFLPSMTQRLCSRRRLIGASIAPGESSFISRFSSICPNSLLCPSYFPFLLPFCLCSSLLFQQEAPNFTQESGPEIDFNSFKLSPCRATAGGTLPSWTVSSSFSLSPSFTFFSFFFFFRWRHDEKLYCRRQLCQECRVRTLTPGTL